MNNTSISTRLTKKYKVKFPFVAAGMAFVGSTPDLAIAVCEAGGIGSIGVGILPPEAIGPLVGQVKKATKHPFHVNFVTLFATEEHIKACIDAKVPIVSFHFGHPPKHFIDLLHQAKIDVWEQVGSVESAQKAIADGIDLIIAQGTEAGGHNFSTLPSFVLVPQVVAAVKPVMVLASGGVTTGSQIAATLCLGADGVWVGTRLVASNEAFAHPVYKTRLTTEDGTDTTLTHIFGPEMPNFNPVRAIKNEIVTEFIGKEDTVPTDTSNEPIIGKTEFFGQEIILRRFNSFPPVATTEGDFEEMLLAAGQGVGMVHTIKPVKDIVNAMMSEAVSTLSGLHNNCN